MRNTPWRERTNPDDDPTHLRVRDDAIFTVQEHPVAEGEWTCGVQAFNIGFLTLKARSSLAEAKSQADDFDLTPMRERLAKGDWPPPDVRRER